MGWLERTTSLGLSFNGSDPRRQSSVKIVSDGPSQQSSVKIVSDGPSQQSSVKIVSDQEPTKPKEKQPRTEIIQLLQVQESATDISRRSPVWTRAWEKYAATLSPEDRDTIFRVTSGVAIAPLSSNDVVRLLGPLRSAYDNTVFETCRRSLGPIVSRLKAFTSIVDVFVQSNPDVSALIWGSIKTLLTVLVQNQSWIELVTKGLDQISFELPLFDRWSRQFPETEFSELHETLTGAYCEIIGFCVDVLALFRKSPAANCFRVVLPDVLGDRIKSMNEQMRRLKLQFDTESFETLNAGIQKLLSGKHIHSKSIPDKPIYHVPTYKVPRYFPRPELEETLLSAISRNINTEGFGSLCVHGPRGAGKTQLVLEVIRKVRTSFPSVLWFHASSVEKLDKEFGRVGEKLGIPVTSNEGGSVIDIVLDWLCCADQPWIVVYDDANDVAVLNEVWPNNAAKGLVIAITNDPVAMNARTATSVHVPLYTKEQGAAYLAFHLGDTAGPNVTSDDDQLALYRTISETLSAFPLSLAIAADFMSTSSCGPEEFIEVLEDSPFPLLKGPAPGYSRSIEDIIKMSFSGLQVSAERLLDILAFFDSDSIPLAMLKNPVLEDEFSEYKFLGNAKAFRFAYRELRSRSLIQHNDDDTVSFHPFFQDAIIAKIRNDKTKYQHAFEASLQLLLTKFPSHTFSKRRDVESWKTCETYIEHVRFLDRRCLENDLSPEVALRMAGLNYRAAWFFFERGRLQRGLSSIERSRSFLRADHPDNLVLLADTYWMQGRFYNTSNQPDKSEPMFANAVKYAEQAVSLGLLAPSAPRLASMYSSLGNAFTGLKQFDKATRFHLESIRVRESDPSTQGEMIAMSYTNLGSCLLWQGALDAAEETLHKVLHRFNRRLECSQYAMGNVYLAQDRVQAALDLHSEVLSRFLERSGYDHTDTAHSCHKVGVLHHMLGEPDMALVFLSKALDIYDAQKRHSDIRPARARTLWYLGKVLDEAGSLDRASEVRAEAAELFDEVEVYKDPAQTDPSKRYDELVFFWYR